MPAWYFHVVMPLIIGILAISMLTMGLWVLVTRRPYLISARWMLAFVLLAFLPSALLPVMSTLLTDDRGSASDNVVSWAGPAIFLALAIFMFISMKGYVAIGITENSIREGLFSSLRTLNLQYEETLGSIRIPSASAEIQVAVQGWIGSGQLKARHAQSRALLKDVASGINKHFRQTKVQANLVTPILYVVMGVLLGVMDVALVVAR